MKNSDTRLCLQLSKKLYEKLKRLASKKGLNASALIRLILTDYLEDVCKE